MMNRSLFCLFAVMLLHIAQPLSCQDLPRYQRIVRQLSSSKYQGRGYARNGVRKASRYIQKEFRKAHVDSMILQPFCLDINTFPGQMKLSVDGRQLVAGRDFTVREYNPATHGTFRLYHIDTLHYDFERIRSELALPQNQGAFVVCDFWFPYQHRKDFSFLQNPDSSGIGGLLYTWNEPLKFYKAYGERVAALPTIWTLSSVLPPTAETITADIDQRFYKDYQTENVIAKVEGQRHDSCYVFTAHYDHLGNLGKKVFYAGANDNASGTAAIVTLAAYYAKHRPPYDMYFIAFSGEDANLRGSNYYVEHPIVPLSQIKYLFNIDMIGDNNPVQYCEVSDEGMRGYSLFEKINTEKYYFKTLHRGDLAANSDHYPFATRHVPCIFLENEKGDAFQYYHTIFDTYKTVRFDSYEPVSRLVRDFVEQY